MPQRYLNLYEHSRMRLGQCPECGQEPDDHKIDRHGKCSITPRGVRARIQQLQFDTSAGTPLPRFCIIPGYIKSSYDEDVHYVGVGQLVRLYHIPHGLWHTYDNRLCNRRSSHICIPLSVTRHYYNALERWLEGP